MFSSFLCWDWANSNNNTNNKKTTTTKQQFNNNNKTTKQQPNNKQNNYQTTTTTQLQKQQQKQQQQQQKTNNNNNNNNNNNKINCWAQKGPHKKCPKKRARQIMCLNHPGGQVYDLPLFISRKKVDHTLPFLVQKRFFSAEWEGWVDHVFKPSLGPFFIFGLFGPNLV